MRMGTTINAKGWALITEGLSTLEVATAGADVPQLWIHYETFFGKVDDNLEETLSHISSTSATFRATHKCKAEDPNVYTAEYDSVYPTVNEEEPGNPSVQLLFIYLFIYLNLLKICSLIMTAICLSYVYSHFNILYCRDSGWPDATLQKPRRRQRYLWVSLEGLH